MVTKQVVAATDGSEHSLRVLPHAFRLAQAVKANLRLVRVLEDHDLRGKPGESEDATLDQAKTRLLAEMQSSVKGARISANAEVALREDSEGVVESLVRHATEADVFVLHSRGRSAVGRLLYGSVALGVLSKVTVPVLLGGPELLVPSTDTGTYRLIITTDLSPASEHILRAIAPILPFGAFDATLLYVHQQLPRKQDDEAVFDRTEAKMEEQLRLLPSSAHVELFIKRIATGGGVDTAILEQAQALNSDAIAMSTHGHSARHHLLMGSVALSILKRSPLPLLLGQVTPPAAAEPTARMLP